jgi:hypothetical protein
MAIEADTMQHRLGKRLDQEEVYCTFRPKDIYENMEDSHVSKPAVMKILNAIVDYADVRMIMFRPLRQHEPPSVMKERLVTPEKGGFVGLDFSLPPHNKRNKAEVNEVTPPDTPESSVCSTPEPKGPVLSKKKGPVLSKEKGPVLSKEKGPVYEDVEEKPIPTKPMEYADLTYYYSGPAPDLDTYFYKDKADMTPEEKKPEEKPAPTRLKKVKPPVEDIWAVYNRLVHRPERTTKRSIMAKKDLVVPDFDASGVAVKRASKKSVVTDIEEVVPLPLFPESAEEPDVVEEPRKEETTFLKNRWYKEIKNKVDEKETTAEVVLKLPGREEQEELFDQARDLEQEETDLFQQNGVLDGARALFDINHRKMLKRITRKSYGQFQRKEIGKNWPGWCICRLPVLSYFRSNISHFPVVYKIPKEAVLKLQEKNGQEMWPQEIDLFEPFQKAIECTRDFRGPHWTRFWDEKVREEYVAQREALFRLTAKRSEYNPHARSVAEKQVKFMDTILEWLVCGHASSLDPDGEIAAVYARLTKKQQQAPIFKLTKTIEKKLFKKKEADYIKLAKEEVSKAGRQASEVEQKVLEAETVQNTIPSYAHLAGAVELAKPEQTAAETEQSTAEGVATLLAAKEMEEKQEAVLEPDTYEDDEGRNLEVDIANWLLDPQDAKDSTGEFKMLNSTFPAKENQNPFERASDMALKILFLRNSYADWVASMKAQDEDIMRGALAKELGKERGATVFACFKWLRDADPRGDPSGELACIDAELLNEGGSLEHRARVIGTILSFSYSTWGPSMLAKTMAIEEHQSDQLRRLYAQYGPDRSMRLRRIYCWLENRCLENDPSGEIAMLYNLLTFKPDAAPADMAQEIEENMDCLEDRLGDDWIDDVRTATTLCSKKHADVNSETSKSKSKKAPTKEKAWSRKSARKSDETVTSKKAIGRKRAFKNEAARKMARTSHLESSTSDGAPSTKKRPTSTKARASEEAPIRELESSATKGVPPTMEATKVPTSQKDAANAKASTSKKASRPKTAPTSTKVRTNEETPTNIKPEDDSNDGTRGRTAKPTINKRKSCKRSRGDGQDSKKTKMNGRSAMEITPEGSADGDQVHISQKPPIGIAPVALASDSRFYGPLALAGQHAGILQRQMQVREDYGPLDLAGQHAGMLQRQMPVRNEVLRQRQTPAHRQAMLPHYSVPAYQDGFVQLNSGGKPLFLTGDSLSGGKVEWHVGPEAPRYNIHPPGRPRTPGDFWPY